MYKKCEKVAAWFLFAVLILSLLPVMYLGRYNHPAGDDYYYGAETKYVWEESGSVIATVAEAVKGVAYQYNNWQGTYSAMLLMYLPPNIFGENAYRFVTAAILLLLTGSIFYLLKPIVKEYMKGSNALWVIASSILSLLCIQTVPSQGETFFWYNGSMYYTGYYAVTLILFGVVMWYLQAPQKRHLPIMIILAVFLAGGNYVSLLPAIILMVALAVFLAYKRSGRAWGIGCTAVVMIVFLMISAAAPGNLVRQSGMWKIPAWKAVLKSLLQGVRYAYAWMRIWWIMAALVVTPFLWKTFSKVSYSFRYPLIVCGFVYGVFCSMSCPTFYTMNSTGPARAVAIVYYGFLLFTFICYYYLLGYVYRWMEKKQLLGKCRLKAPVPQGIWAGMLLLMLVIQTVSGMTAQCTTAKAARILASGEAVAYEQEYQARLAILTDPTVTDVVFTPYENQPDMLYVGDMPGDAFDPTNQKTAQYFGKNTVRVQY